MILLLCVVLVVAAVAWWAWESSRRRRHPVPEGYQPDIVLPHGKEFELYHNALSLCSMKSRFCLAELGIEYESHPIDLIETGAYENIRRPFLSVNPGGTVTACSSWSTMPSGGTSTRSTSAPANCGPW